jgi:hypothetical protein
MALTMAQRSLEEGILAQLIGAFGWLALMTFARTVAHRQASSSLGVQSARFDEWMFRGVALMILPFSILYIRDLSNFCFTLALLFAISHLYFKASDTPPPKGRRKLSYNQA